MLPEAPAGNSAQREYWNAAAGLTWAKLQQALDRQIEPLGREAMRLLGPQRGERVLDIGCGCGQTSLELARRVAPTGAVVAADLSRPMLAVARARLGESPGLALQFVEIDAQTESLGVSQFDAAFSRFGVMFFSDPVGAFANIRCALRPAARLAFVCWRPLAENLWMRVPLEAARHLLPPIAPPEPEAPGPFAFADPDRVRRILAAAGYEEIHIDAFDAAIGGADLRESVTIACRLGPLGSALREHPECIDAVSDAVQAALAPHATVHGVHLPAAVWLVRAVNGAA